MTKRERYIKYFFKNKNLSPEKNLIYNTTLSQPIEAEIKGMKDPINKIFNLFNIKNIKKIILNEDENIYKFLYFNKQKIISILYENEEFIYVKENNNIELNIIFYLSLLIRENENIINFTYSIELIKNLNDKRKKEQKKIRKIMIAKILLELIYNYKGIDDSDKNNNEYDDELDRYNNENLETIHQNIDSIKKFNLNENDILTQKIDKLYAIIINNIIMNKKLDESQSTNDILEQLDLKLINITKDIFDELVKILDKEKNYIKDFIISEGEDLFDSKKLNFYYILIKDILKSDFYIYQIPFLVEIRNEIIKIIKTNNFKCKFSNNQEKDKKNKIEYLLKAFSIDFHYNSSKVKNGNNVLYISNLDSTIETQNFSINNKNSLNDRNNKDINYFNYNNYDSTNSNSFGFYKCKSYLKEKEKSGRSFEPYEDNIKYEEEKCKEYINDKCFRLMYKSCFNFRVFKNNDKKMIKYDNIICNNNEEIKIDNLKNITSGNNIIANNFKKFLSILPEIENKFKDETRKNNFKCQLKFEMENFLSNIFYVNCLYNIQIDNETETLKFKDENILENGLKEGIMFAINEINSYE